MTTPDHLTQTLARLRAEVGKVIVGQDTVVEELLLAILAGGHALLEGVPGLAKTLLVRTLADATGLSFRRIQFTPDLMPSDILGTEVLEEDHATGRRFFKFNQGPVFAQMVLADEINRTPPKTQAALLEAMQEGAVTYAGTTHALERPFFVLATQNPIEQTGTYPLPEAQLDRFLLYIRVGYPTLADERAVLARTTGAALPRPQAVAGAADILAAQALVREVTVSDALLDYATRLVRASRPADTDVAYVKEWVRWGAGPRAGQGIILAGKARALLHGRFAATLDDLRAVAAPVLRHRVLVNFRAEGEGVTPDDVTGALLTQVPAPKSPLG
ncbi:MAG: MoxR family ATPase [Gemmatimonadetes bacterium]|nr:MoxR family ATPase [Gemmatimonadota bacterium]MBK7785070.1 MoxR family ATPase [Gemmatimonadota bacterium]